MSELFGNTQERRWYIVQTYSGYENKVKANLDQRIATMGMEDRIFRVLVPVEEKVTIKEGKTKRVKRKVFPSYVLVEMILEDQSVPETTPSPFRLKRLKISCRSSAKRPSRR